MLGVLNFMNITFKGIRVVREELESWYYHFNRVMLSFKSNRQLDIECSEQEAEELFKLLDN